MSDFRSGDSGMARGRLTTSTRRTRVPNDLSTILQIAETHGESFETILLAGEADVKNELPKDEQKHVLIALSDNCLLLSRQNDFASTFFRSRFRVLPHGEWSLTKGSGFWSFDLGLRLSSGGGLRTCRIQDAAAETFAVILATADLERFAMAANHNSTSQRSGV